MQICSNTNNLILDKNFSILIWKKGLYQKFLKLFGRHKSYSSKAFAHKIVTYLYSAETQQIRKAQKLYTPHQPSSNQKKFKSPATSLLLNTTTTPTNSCSAHANVRCAVPAPCCWTGVNGVSTLTAGVGRSRRDRAPPRILISSCAAWVLLFVSFFRFGWVALNRGFIDAKWGLRALEVILGWFNTSRGLIRFGTCCKCC